MRSTNWGRSRTSSSFLFFAAFFLLIVAVGGASRADSQAQIFARGISVAFATAAAIFLPRNQLERVSAPLFFFLAIAVLMLLQLVPLPAALWVSLPGREELASLMQRAGVPPVARPLSLDPDATLNSLWALLPGIACLLILSQVSERNRDRLAMLLVGVAFFSGLVGVLQISSGSQSLYFYRITNQGAAVGLFANRNHQGLLLALTLPLLVRFALAPTEDVRRRWVATGIAAFMVPLIVVTGSRAALLVGLLGSVGAYFALGGVRRAPIQPKRRRRHGRARRRAPILVAAGAAVIVLATALSSRAQSVQRLFSEDVSQEIRLRLFEPLLMMGWKYFPVGAGFGSFVPLYQMHERPNDLSLSYLNHAHNDLLELFIEAGLPGLLLLLCFALWAGRAAFRSWTADDRTDQIVFGRLASVMIAMVGLASLADYPLRTPTISVVFALLLHWLHQASREAASPDRLRWTVGQAQDDQHALPHRDERVEPANL